MKNNLKGNNFEKQSIKIESSSESSTSENTSKKISFGFIILLIFLIIAVIASVLIYFYYPKKETIDTEKQELIVDDTDEINEDRQAEEVEQLDDILDEIQEEVEAPIVDTTKDDTLPQFAGYTTIAKVDPNSSIDIEKGTYKSPNGEYSFKFQNNNNVVIYKSNTAVWATMTNHSSDSYLRLESDGNLIVDRAGEKVWESSTTGGGQFLALSNQGQIAMLDEDGEVIEYIIEFHKQNANITKYILSNSDLYRYFSSWYGPSFYRGICEDKIGGCRTHKKNQGCSVRNPKHDMWRTNCVKTCNYCSDSRYLEQIENTCEDILSGCDGHKSRGGCSDRNSSTHTNWRRRCRKTCGFCNDPRYNNGNQNNNKDPSWGLAYPWDIKGIIDYHNNTGKNKGRTMEMLTEQDNIYNEEGFQVKKMPLLENSNFEYNGQQYSSQWIWKSDMPLQAGGSISADYFNNHRLMSVPIEVVKFYYDYKNFNQTDVNAIFLVDCDDGADIIFNDIYIKSIINGPHEINVVLKPGKNRFMCVCRNTGGPAGLRAVLIDPVSKQQLMNTNLNWRYIDDLYNIIGQDATRNGKYLEFSNVNLMGNDQYHYDYVNDTGQDQKLKIEFNFDNYGSVWIDRKLINSKSMGDGTPFYAIVPPGKSHITVEIINYGGPGRLDGKITDIDRNETVLSTGDHGWRFIHSEFKPGPWNPIEIFEHANFRGIHKKLWIGHFDQQRMESIGMPNDMISSIKVPRMLECTLWHGTPGPDSKYFAGNHGYKGDVGRDINDRTSALTIKTKTRDRVYFFQHPDGRNGGGGESPTKFSKKWYIEQTGMSNFHPQLGGESVGNRQAGGSENWNQQCANHTSNSCSNWANNIRRDEISSVWVPKGFKASIWEHDNFTGHNEYHGPHNGDHMFNLARHDFNDSIKVTFDFSIGTKFNVMNDYLL